MTAGSLPLDSQGNPLTNNRQLLEWVGRMAALTKPDRVVWIDGSEHEKKLLTDQAVAQKVLEPLNQDKLPGCYLHRSNPNDVARVEQLTFICTPTKDEAGPTNNWMDPAEAYAKLSKLFDGSMKGKAMYVVPYVMGPANSRMSKVDGSFASDLVRVSGRVLSERLACPILPRAIERFGPRVIFGTLPVQTPRF
jgi:phosphoenolpyruvate carboxykinase (GTP)